jgi:multidrug resistance efflux pump
MVLALSSLNGGTPSVQAQLSQYRAQLQQARQEAAQAADRVARLEQQTQTARSESVRADDRVRGIERNEPRPPAGTPPTTRRAINSLSQLSGTVLDVMA